MRRFGLAFAATGLAACATPPPPQPAALDEGLLIARVGVHGTLFARSTKWADTAEIAAFDAAGVPVPGHRAKSSFSANGYVVFFGMHAGRYALRAASFKARGARYQVRVPAEGELKRIVELRPGTAAFLGDLRFDTRKPELVVALGRAARVVGHWLTPFLKRPLLPRDVGAPLHESGPDSEVQALRAVRGALAATQWSPVVSARLRELSAPEPATTAGVLRARELPLREEPFFSWRDTLKWGEPKRSPVGLAWRRPGGEAQIAVFFTTASAPGFQGWAEAVSELRRSSAESVEDRGGVYEVRAATRTGVAARVTKYRYPDGVLVGSEAAVVVTETLLIPDGWGLFTARLRAPRSEFDAALPAYREFLLQLSLGSPKSKPAPKQEAVLPFAGSPP